ncbi:MAG: hypothetical protein HYU66_18610 [Armatimonadetes bacterium]|nr:hypothetical protein [Armatimonadota bacterium]
MPSSLQARRSTYAGLFLVSLATLMYEVLLTRIFSVTMWYHFAFMAVSVALFGMTVGALWIYLLPGWFRAERTHHHLSAFALLFAATAVGGLLTHLAIPFVTNASLVSLWAIGLTYAALSLPFACSGVCVCLALTRFPERVGKLYAADLAGAACGCLALVQTLDATDGPTAVLVVGLFAAASGACFAPPRGRLQRVAGLATLLFLVAAVGHTVLVDRHHPLLRITWAKGIAEPNALYERWNSFSRVRVGTEGSNPEQPFGWGLSPVYPAGRHVRQLGLDIDANAYTVLTRYRGDPLELDHLRYDITNLPHYLRPAADVLVVGAGGGRDILSALAFGQRSVRAVEINGAIVQAVNRVFGDFTGHLDRDPRVRMVHDEARSYIARTSDQFDILQISLIDTWAATAAGAFVLSENSLYTEEAWTSFLRHLKPGGLLSISRWYDRGRPAEVYRATALACAALRRIGVTEPRSHLAIARLMLDSQGREVPNGVGTLLVSPSPLTPADVAALRDVCGRLRFELVLAPDSSADPDLERLTSADGPAFERSFPLNISAPTDDCPFFFHQLRFRDLLTWYRLDLTAHAGFNLKAVFVLGSLLLIVGVLTLAGIVVPLWLTSERETLRGSAPLLAYFAAIGLGFMLFEMSQMQRLMVFLGHPTYALTVVLSALLISSGAGSLLSGRLRRGAPALAALLAVLAVLGLLTSPLLHSLAAATTPVRIGVAVVMLAVPGLLMGTAFPLGMRAAAGGHQGLTPWLWGVNGATSVCASVLAVALSLSFGISCTYWIGVLCYAGAAAAHARLSRRV